MQAQQAKKKKLLARLVSSLFPAFDEWWWFRKQARDLARRRLSARSPQDLFSVWESASLTALQKQNEIVPLLELLRNEGAKVVCEIGSYDGGTLFLFGGVASDNARVFSLDLRFGFGRRSAFRRLLRPGQTLHCIEADSHDPSTRDRLRNLLGGEELDFLFIDGDHSFDGVSADFELYSPLVRAGGLIAFHDIVPDFRTRYGHETASNGGDVWRFWTELRTKYADCLEFLHEGPDQDGYGIGVLRLPGVKQS